MPLMSLQGCSGINFEARSPRRTAALAYPLQTALHGVALEPVALEGDMLGEPADEPLEVGIVELRNERRTAEAARRACAVRLAEGEYPIPDGYEGGGV